MGLDHRGGHLASNCVGAALTLHHWHPTATNCPLTIGGPRRGSRSKRCHVMLGRTVMVPGTPRLPHLKRLCVCERVAIVSSQPSSTVASVAYPHQADEPEFFPGTDACRIGMNGIGDPSSPADRRQIAAGI